MAINACISTVIVLLLIIIYHIDIRAEYPDIYNIADIDNAGLKTGDIIMFKTDMYDVKPSWSSTKKFKIVSARMYNTTHAYYTHTGIVLLIDDKPYILHLKDDEEYCHHNKDTVCGTPRVTPFKDYENYKGKIHVYQYTGDLTFSDSDIADLMSKINHISYEKGGWKNIKHYVLKMNRNCDSCVCTDLVKMALCELKIIDTCSKSANVKDIRKIIEHSGKYKTYPVTIRTRI